MISRRDFFKKCFNGFILLIASKITGCSKKEKNNKNPYEYNIEEFRAIDEELILYKEINSFKTPKLKDFKISNDNEIYALQKEKVNIYNLKGKLLKCFPLHSEANCLNVYNSKIYIAFKQHIQVYDKNFKIEKIWDKLSEKSFITSVSINDKYTVIADSGNKIVWLFKKYGKLIKIIDNKNNNSKGFILPSLNLRSVFDKKSNIWINHSGILKMQQFSIQGDLLNSWGKASMDIDGFPGCCNPIYFTILKNEDFVVSQKGIENIKLYSNDGTFKGVVAPNFEFKEGLKDLIVESDKDDNVFIYDSWKGKIRIFTLKST